jgi:hypothetical protein
MMNTTPHCVLCGRPEDEAYFVVPPSFSWYLSSVGASRCPECGAPQGVDRDDRADAAEARYGQPTLAMRAALDAWDTVPGMEP